MPELPEVEATRRVLATELTGARVRDVSVRRLRMVRRQPRPADFAARLVGRRVGTVGRRGKVLLAELTGDLTWVSHLGMSGRMRLTDSGEPEAPHTNVVVEFDGSRQLRFIDPRTFGYMAVLTPQELADSPLGRIGPDALDDLPRSPELARRLAGRTVPIKALLLDQTFLAGIGNIYADEMLFRAGIRGDRAAGSLATTEVKALRRAVRPVLEAGLKWGGTSLDDLAYLLPDGRVGEFAARLAVYGRQDEPCPRCGTPIRRSVVRGRSTFWCARCQR